MNGEPRGHILLVDDDPLVRRTFGQALRSTGYAVAR